MSIGSLGIVGSLASSTLPQRTAAAEQVQSNATSHAREAQAELKAEAAAGIGRTEEDSESGERDADGRRAWELPGHGQSGQEDPQSHQTTEPSSDDLPRSTDPLAEAGGSLDLLA
jgi:type II secretory pathway pseudopilin PulG